MTKTRLREIGISVEIARDRGDRARDQMLTKMRVSESGMMMQPRATRQIARDRLHLRETREVEAYTRVYSSRIQPFSDGAVGSEPKG